jgi:hypothetical protein
MKWMREKNQLTVHNMGGSWSAAVDAGIKTFNNLGFGVKLVPEKERRSAQIVIKLSNGSETFVQSGDSIIVNFPADKMHGRATTLAHPRLKEIYFAGVFLPGKVQNVTPKQKEVIVVHELIHACGLDGGMPGGGQDPKMDHELVGIMSAQMVPSGDGLLELLPEKGAKPMTPIRVGAQTMRLMQTLWAK